MHITQRMLTALIVASTVLYPAVAFAVPTNVTGVAASLGTEGVVVTWDNAGENIQNYKVFWSGDSILENNALFDHTADTPGPETSYVIKGLPSNGSVYVAVLAVDTDGAESPFFEEEASVTLAPTTAAASSVSLSMPTVMPSSAAMADDDGDLRALSVETLSATGVVIRFSGQVLIDAASARTAFSIKTGSGETLQIARVRTEGATVTLDTLPQVRQRAYILHIDGSVRGKSMDGQTVLTLAPDQTDMLFVGHASGVMPQAPLPSGGNVGDVQQLKVQAQAEPQGTYSLQVTWLPPQGGGVAGYRVAQSRDGGRTYGQPQTLATNVRAVRMQGVQAGELTLLIQAMDAGQQLSRGILQRIILPQAGRTTGRVIPQITPPRSTPPQNGKLPQTGVGTATLLGIAGACAGVQVQRRRRAAR